MRFAPIFATLLLAGCDPLRQYTITVTVSPETQQAFSADSPGQVVVRGDGDSEVGWLCEPSTEPVTFEYSTGGVGCAEPFDVTAWIVPAASGTCDAPVAAPTGDPVEPMASGVMFEGNSTEKCESEDDGRLTLEL